MIATSLATSTSKEVMFLRSARATAGLLMAPKCPGRVWSGQGHPFLIMHLSLGSLFTAGYPQNQD